MNKRQNGLPKKTRDEFKKLPVGERVKLLIIIGELLKSQNENNELLGNKSNMKIYGGKR